MSPRKPTIDGSDDYDDEDGVLEDEAEEDTDLTLHEEEEEEVGLGRTPPGHDEYIEDGGDDEEDTR
jgi:hypothetical protein